MTGPQRAQVLKQLYGEHGGRRDVMALSDHERRILDQHRALTPAARQAPRLLYELLPRGNAHNGGNEASAESEARSSVKKGGTE